MTSPPATQGAQNGSALLRGGRLRKTSRGLLTFAPALALTASTLALAALLSLAPTQTAQAGSCTENPADSGMFHCSGAAGTDSQAIIRGDANQNVTVTSASDFGINVAKGDAIFVGAPNGNSTFTLTFNGSITANASDDKYSIDGNGISVQPYSNGAITLTSNATINSFAHGIHLNHSGSGDITITANGAITSSGATDGGGKVGSGIYVFKAGSGNVNITAGADLTGTIDDGIQVKNRGAESHANNTTITIESGDTVTGATGIYVFHSNAEGASSSKGDILIDIAGTVTSTDGNQDALKLTDGASHTLRLRTGAAINGSIDSNRTDGTLEVIGTPSFSTRSFGGFPNINFNAAETATATDTLSVMDFAAGGTVTMNVAFNSGTDAADVLTIAGAVTGSAMTTINLIATGAHTDLDSGGLRLIDGPTATGTTSFTAGSVTFADGSQRSFTLTRDSTSGDWEVTAVGAITRAATQTACTNQGSGAFQCTGSNITDAISLSPASGETLTVTDMNFSMNVATGNALTLSAASGSTGMSLDIDGNITATAGVAIFATHNGGGAVSIMTDGTIMAGNIGISAGSQSASTTMDITTGGTITAAHRGIAADHQGSGNLTITTNAAVTSTGEEGIYARVRGGSSALTIDANAAITANASAGKDGIQARHQASGALSITAAAITSTAGDGIDASSLVGNGMTITANGNITASRGIVADNQGNGALSITTKGALMTASDGINASAETTTTTVTIMVEGDITATGGRGIDVTHEGNALLSITLASDTTLRADSAFTGHGIRVREGDNSNTGGVAITSTGASIGTAANPTGEEGILVTHKHRAPLTITAGSINATKAGISATTESTATGGMTIRANANITAGSGNHAIHASQQGSGDLDITVASGATITGGSRGINALAASGVNVTLDIAGTIASSGSSVDVIGLNGGASHTIRLRDGAAISGGINSSLAGSTLEVIGSASIDGAFSAFNAITLASSEDSSNATTDSLTVMDFASGSNLTLNVNFTDATADSLTIGGDVSGSAGAITINLVATAGTLDALTGAVTLVTFTIPANLDLTEFTAGSLTGTDTASFTLSADTTAGTLQIMSAATGGDGGGGGSGGTPDPDPEPMLMLVDGTCTEQDATPGRFACSGAVTTAQTLEAGTGETLSVSTHGDDFSITVASGTALDLDAGSGSTGMDITIGGPVTAQDTATTAHAIAAETNVANTSGNMSITTTEAATIMASGGDGIHADNNGTGTTSITTNAAITSTSGHGISVTTGGIEGMTDRSTSITANAMITTSAANKAGIHVNQQTGANGDLTITAADITSGGEGIRTTSQTGTSALNITATGSIMATGEGIQALHRRSGDLTITVDPGASVSGSTGIDADTGSGNPETDIIIEVAGSVTGTAASNPVAIEMNSAGEHTLRLRPGFSLMGAVTSDATDADMNPNATLELAASAADDADTDTSAEFDLGDLDDFTGFTVFEKTGDGTWTLTGTQTAADDDTDRSFTNADVMAGTLQLEGAAFHPGDDTLSIASGATLEITGSTASTIAGAVNNSGSINVMEDVTITGNLSNAMGSTLNLNAAALTLDDMGSPTTLSIAEGANLHISGSSAINAAITNNGSIHLDAATLTLGGSAPLPLAEALNVTGANSITGALDNSAGAAISLALGDMLDATDTLSVSGAFTSGGSVTLDMDFTGTTPTADQLTFGSVTAGSDPTTVNLRIASDRDLSDADIPADLPLVAVSGSSSADAFTAAADNGSNCSVPTTRSYSCNFTLNHTAGSGWQLDSLLLEFLASDPSYEGYAATLTSLSQLPGMSARLANRAYDPRNAIWGQIQGSQTTLKPNATSPNAEYDMQHSRVRFGFDMPATPLQGAFDTAPILGFNAWLGQSETDITATDAEPGEIDTNAFALAATATLQQGTFHFDGQLQYAAFSSDISVAGSSRANNLGGDAITAAAEIGMKLPEMHGITLTPQVQLSWTSIDFDTFTDSEDSRISLADGETTAARFGITATTPLTAEGLSLFSPRPIPASHDSARLRGERGAAPPEYKWAREARGWVGDGAGTFLHASADLHLPLDGKTSARIDDNTAISDLEEESLSLGIGMSHNWNATTLSADLATTQGEDIETYRASLSATLAF